jgi:hypothetical protein
MEPPSVRNALRNRRELAPEEKLTGRSTDGEIGQRIRVAERD